MVAIKNKKLAAIDAWRKSRLATGTLILNGEEEVVRRQRREEIGKAVDMNFREILERHGSSAGSGTIHADRPFRFARLETTQA